MASTNAMNTSDNETADIIITDAAAEKVSELLNEEDDPHLKLRVSITGGGCSGFKYDFSFDDKQNEDDTVITKNGVSILIDVMAFSYLVGSEIDYREDLQGSQFIIRNPNAKRTCGCGSSFEV